MEHLSDVVRYSLVGIFSASAALHLLIPSLFHKLGRRTYNPNSKSRAIAMVTGLSALFLSIPQTIIWGIVLGGFTLFVVVIGMLQNGRYGIALTGMLLMMSLPLAVFSSMDLK